MSAKAWMIEQLGGQQPPDIICFGEPDDHLRVVVMLAELIQQTGARTEDRSIDPDAVQTCQSPRSAWCERVNALRALLASPVADGLSILDIDALYQGELRPETRWDDASSAGERGQVFELLVETAASKKWTLLRTVKDERVTGSLRDAAVEVHPAAADDVSCLQALAPEIRPPARWLLEKGFLHERQLERFIEASDHAGSGLGNGLSAEDNILWTVYDCLPTEASYAAHLLAPLRPPQERNGHLGPFRWSDPSAASSSSSHATSSLTSGPTAPPVPRLECLDQGGVDVLCEVGLLQSDRSDCLRMPRLIRRFLLRRAEGNVGPLDALHSHIADHLTANSSGPAITSAHHGQKIEPRIEAHYHAIMANRSDLAWKTAYYYVTDLRQLAFRLSAQKRYQEAAEIYRRIVEEYDSQDAYAWEYLGFNRIMQCVAHERDIASRGADVEQAYSKAHELEPNNPLYHGRLLGLRAQLGQQVDQELDQGVKKYDHSPIAVSFFVRPVLAGLRRSEQVTSWEQARDRFEHLVMEPNSR